MSQTDTDSVGAGRGGTGHEDEAAVGGDSCWEFTTISDCLDNSR